MKKLYKQDSSNELDQVKKFRKSNENQRISSSSGENTPINSE